MIQWSHSAHITHILTKKLYYVYVILQIIFSTSAVCCRYWRLILVLVVCCCSTEWTTSTVSGVQSTIFCCCDVNTSQTAVDQFLLLNLLWCCWRLAQYRPRHLLSLLNTSVSVQLLCFWFICSTGIRCLMTSMATLLQGNQELLVVKDKVGRPHRWAWDKQVNGIWHFSLQWLTLLVGWQEWHPACKKMDVGLLVVMIWLELCTTYSSSIPLATTTSIIVCCNKHRLTRVHLENGR